jgi:hypothetical protein
LAGIQEDPKLNMTNLERQTSSRIFSKFILTKRTRRIILLMSIGLFIISLTQPAFYIDNPHDSASWSNGIILILIGWLGTISGGGAAFAWIANPLIFFSWFLFFRDLKNSMWTSILATIFAASFLLFDDVVGSEAPTYYTVTAIKLGYWLWLTSIALFAFLTIVIYLIARQNNSISTSGIIDNAS